MATKNVVLKDSSGTELLPRTTAAQVKSDSGGGDLFSYSSNTLSLAGSNRLNGASIKDATITGAKLSDKTIAPAKLTGLSHNCILRGKDITSYYKDKSLWSRIAGSDGFEPFEDLYIGDYFQMGGNITCPDSYLGEKGSNYVVIAGFNAKYGNGDSTMIDFNHIVVVPGRCNLTSNDYGTQHFGRHAMNSSGTTEGGYAGSVMHNSVYGADSSNNAILTAVGTINYQLYAEFGSHLKKTRELLSTAMGSSLYNRFGSATGASSSWAWCDCYAVNMSEVEAFGATVWSSSGYDTGTAKTQFPLFAFSAGALNGGTGYWWLKDVASASHFCNVDNGGLPDCSDASHANCYVRPCFVLA